MRRRRNSINVPKSLGRDQGGPGSLVLEDGVGRHRRGMDQKRSCRSRGPRPGITAGHTRDQGLGVVFGVERTLRVSTPARIVEEDDVGKRAADIDSDFGDGISSAVRFSRGQ